LVELINKLGEHGNDTTGFITNFFPTSATIHLWSKN